jgi:hypothetical protein
MGEILGVETTMPPSPENGEVVIQIAGRIHFDHARVPQRNINSGRAI